MIEISDRAQAIAPDFDEVYRVGVLAGEDWEQFTSIRDFGFDSAGNLHVFDDRAAKITVVSPSGELVRSFGGRGDGPGEFRRAISAAVFRDGRLVVADRGHGGFMVFAAHGEYERLVRMPTRATSTSALKPFVGQLAVVESGTWRAADISFGPGGLPDLTPPDLLERTVLEGDSVEVEPIAKVWSPPRDESMDFVLGDQVFHLGVGRRTFQPALLPAPLPGGAVAFVDSTAYAIKIAEPGAGVVRILLGRPDAKPVTERVKDAVRRRRTAELEATGEEDAERRAKNIRFYHEVPAVRDLQATWSGRLWVQRYAEDGSGGAIDVVSVEDGVRLATFPAGTPFPAAFGPGGLAAFVEDAGYDMKQIVVVRLPVRAR